jgi:hypothetical protein
MGSLAATGTTFAGNLRGWVAEVYAWSRPLSPAERWQTTQGFQYDDPSTLLVAGGLLLVYYAMEEGEGASLRDSTAKQPAASLRGGAVWSLDVPLQATGWSGVRLVPLPPPAFPPSPSPPPPSPAPVRVPSRAAGGRVLYGTGGARIDIWETSPKPLPRGAFRPLRQFWRLLGSGTGLGASGTT